MVTVVERLQKPLLGKVRISSTLRVETGLHIGGGGESLEIGGLDKAVIRDPITRQPYLPGSAIKGKLRATLERLLNKPLNRSGGSGTYRYESDDLVNGYSILNGDQVVAFEGARTCTVSRMFGSTGKDCWIASAAAEAEGLMDEDAKKTKKSIQAVEHVKIKGRNAPARLIVRDCPLKADSIENLKQIDTGLYMTEWKFENGLDRVTAAANPRQIERVPAGAEFEFEMVYTIEDAQQAIADLQNLAIALALLEDDALGGHGSRGYGKVRFKDFKLYYRGIDQYQQVARGEQSFLAPMFEIGDTAALLEDFSQLSEDINRRLPSRGDSPS